MVQDDVLYMYLKWSQHYLRSTTGDKIQATSNFSKKANKANQKNSPYNIPNYFVYEIKPKWK